MRYSTGILVAGIVGIIPFLSVELAAVGPADIEHRDKPEIIPFV